MAEHSVLQVREDIERLISGQTICDLLRRNAEQHGEKPALSWKEDGVWHTKTWRDYRQQVADVAVGLAELGAERGDVVAIMGANRREHVLADQGAVHVGATTTTFYQTLAPDQLAYVATNCKPKVVILENRDYMKRWLDIRDEIPFVEHFVLWEHADEFEDVLSWGALKSKGNSARHDHPDRFDELWRQVEPEDVVTLIYTSGTTGPPKGVPITHHNVLFEAESLDRIADIENFTTFVSYLPLAHIAERELSIYNALKKVAHAYFCPDPKQVLEYVTEARPAIFVGVPRVWEKVKAGITAKVEAEESDTKRRLAERAIEVGTAVVKLQQRGKQPSLLLRAEHALLDRLVLSKIRHGIGMDRCEFAVTSTAPLPPDVALFFAAIGLPLIEIWGMTELTGAATCNPKDAIRLGTVGTALPGVEVEIAEEDGEILVRGPIVTPGYWNRPEATAELIDEDGWLHTGDVGEIDADGYIKIVDRKKELIITAGGKNLSPANIEALLKEHPLVSQALAFGDQKPFVVALLVLDGEVAPTWAQQRGIDVADVAALADDPRVLEEIGRAVDRANEKLARVEQVKKWKLLPTEWTAESEELTPTMKLKRRVVHDRYHDEIEALYA
ncbi:MAG: AMP-dependent synthetase/ligase [Nitriliruptorales bacterium]